MSATSTLATSSKTHDTPQGQRAVQDLHDMACQHGATCKASNVTMASRHEGAAIQKVHDLMVAHGATCARTDRSAGRGPLLFSAAPAQDARAAAEANAQALRQRGHERELARQQEHDRLLGMTQLGRQALERKRPASEG